VTRGRTRYNNPVQPNAESVVALEAIPECVLGWPRPLCIPLFHAAIKFVLILAATVKDGGVVLAAHVAGDARI
jgi:hypothetical protein